MRSASEPVVTSGRRRDEQPPARPANGPEKLKARISSSKSAELVPRELELNPEVLLQLMDGLLHVGGLSEQGTRSAAGRGDR
jgi:hypothetical protein